MWSGHGYGSSLHFILLHLTCGYTFSCWFVNAFIFTHSHCIGRSKKQQLTKVPVKRATGQRKRQKQVIHYPFCGCVKWKITNYNMSHPAGKSVIIWDSTPQMHNNHNFMHRQMGWRTSRSWLGSSKPPSIPSHSQVFPPSRLPFIIFCLANPLLAVYPES